MLAGYFRSIWAEDRAPGAPHRTWQDWALVGGVVIATVLEGSLRTDVTWPAVSAIVGVWLTVPLLIRRTEPLLAVALGFGAISAVDLAAELADVTWEGHVSYIVVLLLNYSLFRWGSGREAALGLGVLAVPLVLSVFEDTNTVGDMIGGVVIMLLACEVGAHIRFQDKAKRNAIDDVKVQEREQLARELHDTVAHHVSAIAVQAQAGRTVAASNPDKAITALAAIEEEASRALAEMRAMVGVLRQGSEPELAPQPGVADLESLTTGLPERPAVAVELVGAVGALQPSIDAAVYRLARESITNAVRHATNATRVDVKVVAEPLTVRLTVRDDGTGSSAASGPGGGYGLLGMAERVKLLGGTLDAGPADGRGWVVEAVLPRTGVNA